MSLPPPPGSFGQQPPMGGGGQPGGGAPQPWQQPGGQAGPPPGGPPPWGPQQQWAGGPPPPPNGGRKTKWILGGLALVLAIALAVVITVLVVKPDSGGNGPSNAGPEGSKSVFASADDTGPAGIITDDPTCDAWNSIANEYASAAKSVNWDDRDFNIPASSWTSEQRGMYESVGKAMTEAGDQTANLVKKTPHRVMRALYGQFIAYTRAFVERIQSYTADDDNLVAASNGAGSGLVNICAAIRYRSAQAVAPLVEAVPGPTKVAAPQEASAPARFLAESNPTCSDWDALVSKFDDDTKSWRSIDKNIPAKEWSPEQKSVNDAVAPIMTASADEIERLGRQSGNPELEDIAILAAQYRRAFVIALPGYTAADAYLELTATNLVRLVNWACKSPS
ncbi:hypothetical protein [Mycobacterium sp. DL99]|uniref:hypothetical protein n=1 Tax=Mycobacterium sp. DL99 TaxID=2528957 RepID=UPI001081BB3C|nr:hypothetical protein [Mycobacterium sp. DL99]